MLNTHTDIYTHIHISSIKINPEREKNSLKFLPDYLMVFSQRKNAKKKGKMTKNTRMSNKILFFSVENKMGHN